MPRSRPKNIYHGKTSPVYLKCKSVELVVYAENLSSTFGLTSFSCTELAIFGSFFNVFQYLVQSVDVNIVSEFGESLLQWLCRVYQGSDLIRLIQYVCDRGADVNYCNPLDGSSPLITLIIRSFGRLEDAVGVVAELIKRGANVNHKNMDGRNVFNLLCYENNYIHEDRFEKILSLMKLLVGNTNIDVNNVDVDGKDNLRPLLDKNADSRWGYRLVRWPAVDLLLESGFVVNPSHLEELLWLVVSGKVSDIRKILDFLRLLIEKGVNVNYPKSSPYSGFIWDLCSMNGLATLLEVKGAEPKTDEEETCWRDIIALLLDAGLDVDRAYKESGTTTLMAFCCFYQGNNFLEILRLLLERGADPDAQKPGNSFIHDKYRKKFQERTLGNYSAFDYFLVNKHQQNCILEVYELFVWYGRTGPLTKKGYKLQRSELLRAVCS